MDTTDISAKLSINENLYLTNKKKLHKVKTGAINAIIIIRNTFSLSEWNLWEKIPCGQALSAVKFLKM